MKSRSAGRWKVTIGLAAATVAAAGILGYHPYSEDGGIYLAEIKRALHPTLYPHESAFVAGHLGWSGFTSGVVWMVQSLGWPLDWVMLTLHVLSIFGVLAGVWLLARQCYAETSAQWGAVAAAALCLTLPVAGTSLLLMDPYLTARSVCLAFTMIALGGIAEFLAYRPIESRWKTLGYGLAALLAAIIVHPLMGGYAVAACALLAFAMSQSRWVRGMGVLGFGMTAITAAWLAQATAPPETPEYLRVAVTRYYWFLSQWQWYEVVGVIAPLAILSLYGLRDGRVRSALARAAACLGTVSIGVSLLFAHEGARVHAVARLQPLRSFQVVYIVMLMLLGGWVGKRLLAGSTWRWAVALAAVGGLMLSVQRATYPESAHLELPGLSAHNRWMDAFLWIKENTPSDALAALDVDYVKAPGEDAQGFRSIAERSALPDFSKDGGQAAIRPELTADWIIGQNAQKGLTEESDLDRMHALAPLGVTWIVIRSEGATRFVCPYENERVKVCRLP